MQKIPCEERKKAWGRQKVFWFCESFYEKCEVLTKFCEPIWTNMYYESLWNHVAIQQGAFNRL